MTRVKASPRRSLISSLRDRNGSLLGTSFDEEDEEHLTFEIELHGDQQCEKAPNTKNKVTTKQGYGNHEYFNDILLQRKASTASSSSGTSEGNVSPILPTQTRDRKSFSVGDIGNNMREPEYFRTMSSPSTASTPTKVRNDNQLVRSKSDPPLPLDTSPMSSPSQHRKHGGRSHSMPVASKQSVIQKVRNEHHHHHHYHHHLGGLKPLSWKALFGKPQSSMGSLDEVDSPRHVDGEVDESGIDVEDSSSMETNDSMQVTFDLLKHSLNEI